MHKKLFIPGPTEVRAEILEAMATPMIGHRTSAYATLQAECESKVKQLLFTEGRVFLFTSSSTGVMEGAHPQLRRPKGSEHHERRVFAPLARDRPVVRHTG